jgi:ABC-type dipeptide/oligopeptide/nickel transport system permease subunit
MKFTLPVALGVLLGIVALGVAGLVAGGMMTVQTTLMMVAPSMLVFGLVAFALGVKHGEFRATA